MRFAHFTTAILICAATGALTSCASESDSVSRKDCERLRDHLIEIRMQSVTVDRDQHLIALRSSFDESFITTCFSSTTEEQLACALAAKDSDGLVACAEPSKPPAHIPSADSIAP